MINKNKNENEKSINNLSPDVYGIYIYIYIDLGFLRTLALEVRIKGSGQKKILIVDYFLLRASPDASCQH